MITLVHAAPEEVEGPLWLLEELGLDYRLSARGEQAEPGWSARSVELVEDMARVRGPEAVVHYILGRHGDGRLSIDPADDAYGDYLDWLHFSPTIMGPAARQVEQCLEDLGFRRPSAIAEASRQLALALAEAENRLGISRCFAGQSFTAADILMHGAFSECGFGSGVRLAPGPNTRTWLRRLRKRAAYRRVQSILRAEMETSIRRDG